MGQLGKKGSDDENNALSNQCLKPYMKSPCIR